MTLLSINFTFSGADGRSLSFSLLRQFYRALSVLSQTFSFGPEGQGHTLHITPLTGHALLPLLSFVVSTNRAHDKLHFFPNR